MQRKVKLATLMLVVLLLAAPPVLGDDSGTLTIQVQAQGTVYVPPTKAQMWWARKLTVQLLKKH